MNTENKIKNERVRIKDTYYWNDGMFELNIGILSLRGAWRRSNLSQCTIEIASSEKTVLAMTFSEWN
jgi:hypothetical protein